MAQGGGGGGGRWRPPASRSSKWCGRSGASVRVCSTPAARCLKPCPIRAGGPARGDPCKRDPLASGDELQKRPKHAMRRRTDDRASSEIRPDEVATAARRRLPRCDPPEQVHRYCAFPRHLRCCELCLQEGLWRALCCSCLPSDVCVLPPPHCAATAQGARARARPFGLARKAETGRGTGSGKPSDEKILITRPS